MTYFTSTIYSLAVSFIAWIFSWLPSSTGFSDTIHTAFQELGSQINVLNVILPVDELLIIFGLAFTYFFVVESIFFIMWIIKLLRG